MIALPLLIVILSGLLLQVKKQVAWVQPPTKSGSTCEMTISWSEILDAARQDSNTGVETWDDISRLDVRPGKGLIKIRCENGWELQLDSLTAEVLSSTYRRSDLIESIHDGSFFTETAKLWIFLPNGLVLLILWVSGMYLWYLPISTKMTRKKKQAKYKKNITSSEASESS